MKKIQKKKSKITNNKPKQASSGTEKRRAERLSIPLKVKYKIKGTAGRQKNAPL